MIQIKKKVKISKFKMDKKFKTLSMSNSEKNLNKF